jgi:hypothetical protein
LALFYAAMQHFPNWSLGIAVERFSPALSV